MIAKTWKSAAFAGLAALAALGVDARPASAQTASVYSTGLATPTDMIVLAPGGAAYVSTDAGVFYVPTPSGVAVRISAGVNGYRELAMLPDGTLLAGSTDSNVYRFASGCTTQAACAESVFVNVGPGGVYGLAVDATNGFVFISNYNSSLVYRTNLTGGGSTTFATAAAGLSLLRPAGLEAATDGYLYVGDSDRQRIVRYPTNCVAPCGTGTLFASGGGMTSTRGLARSPTTNILFISDGGALGSGKVYTVGPTGGTPLQYSALTVNGVESIYLHDATTTLYVSGGVGAGSPNIYEISVAAAPALLAPPIPTMTEWAMIVLGMVLAGFGCLAVRRRLVDQAV